MNPAEPPPHQAVPLPEAEHLLGVHLDRHDDDTEYFPPTDPVVIGDTVACGFCHSSMEAIDVPCSEIDGQAGDEALADAVRLELRTDAATSTLDIGVIVRSRVAYLRGAVPGIEDVENAEEVASRLPELTEVVEQLEVGC